MALRKRTIGVGFPFTDSSEGDYLFLNKTPEEEIKSNLIHLLMTRKGERYWLPEFGTNLHQYIFELNDSIVEEQIRQEIYDAVEKFMPNLKIDQINITNYLNQESFDYDINNEYKLTIKIDYKIADNTFQSKNFVILNF